MRPPACALAVPLAVLLAAGGASAAELRVGPGEAIGRIADAARLARDGDTVLIMPGTYRGDVAVWTQQRLTIRGAGPRPILEAGGEAAEGKAIWVFRGGDFRVENMAFRGARVAAGNGAGIRFESGRLQIENCVFEDNQKGILTADSPTAELQIRDSVFRDAPRDGTPLPHLIYVGRIARFGIQGSALGNGYHGHLIKSRAAYSEVRYNRLDDSPAGEAAYEVEFPDGGVAIMVGNLIVQGSRSSNAAIVAYGAEGAHWPGNRLSMAHNTLVNTAPHAAAFLRIWQDRLPGGVELVTRTNLEAGRGTGLDSLPGEHGGNRRLPPGRFDPARPESLRSDEPAAPLAPPLRPTAQFSPPLGTRTLPAEHRWTVGALQTVRHAPH